MGNPIKALGAAGAADLILKTEIISKILDEATQRAKETADFLENISNKINNELE